MFRKFVYRSRFLFTVNYMPYCLQSQIMEDLRSNIEHFQQFLVPFSKEHITPLKDDDTLPYRLLSFFLVEEEVEAEVADWVLQYLTTQKAPNLLASLLSREVTKEVMSWDLKAYLEPLPSNEDDGLNDQADGGDRGSDTTEILEELDDGSRSKTLEIEVCKLAKDVYNRLHEMCKEWSETFPEHLTNKLPQEAKFVAISSHAIKNTRRKMEDRHLILPYLNEHCGLEGYSNQSYFTVFDGHGGSEAAIYSSAHLHHHMTRHTQFKDHPEIAIKEAFITTDQNFVKKAKREYLRSGCTCVFALFRESKLHVAWLGDSQIMMVVDGQPLQMMEPHKPEREDERKRIESLGGFVMWFGQWRVNATLSVSRAIGDADFKPFVSGDPDLATFDLSGKEDYVVIACDGLWDTMSFDDVANEVYDYLCKKHGQKSQVAEILVNKAKEKGSGDNISVVVVFLREDIGLPKPMPVPEKKVVTELGDKQDNKNDPKQDSKDNNTQEQDENNETLKEGPSDSRNVQETTQDGQIQCSLTDEAVKHTIDSANLRDDLPKHIPVDETQIHANAGNCSNIHHPKHLDFIGKYSIRKPLTGYNIMNTSKCLQKPTPYNVYKVLLAHKHKAKLSSSQKDKIEAMKTHAQTIESQSDVAQREVKYHSLCSPVYEESLIPGVSNINISTRSTKYLCLSDKKSETSSTEIAMVTASAKRCITSRKIKKGKNGKRRNIHRDLRRLSRDRLSLGIAERTRSSNSSSSSPRSLQPHAKVLSTRYTTARPKSVHNEKQNSKVIKGIYEGKGLLPGRRASLKWDQEQISRMVTGFGHIDISPTSSESKWTVAREIENASAMFGE